MKSALVLGTGGVGSVIGQRLHTYDCFSEVYLGDMDTQFAEALAAKTDNSRFKIVKLNATDPVSLAAFLKVGRMPGQPGNISGRVMPGFAYLPDPELAALAGFLKARHR